MNTDTLSTAPKAIRIAIARALIDKAAGGEQITASGGGEGEDHSRARKGGTRPASAGLAPAKLGKAMTGAVGLPLVEVGTIRIALRPLRRRDPIMVGRPGGTLQHVDHAACASRAGQSTSVQATTRDSGDVPHSEQ